MKKFILAFLFSISLSCSLASEVIQSSNNENIRILDLVVGLQSTYSQTSQLDAKVFELLAGDGLNPVRLALVLGSGDPHQENRIFELNERVYSVKRITFAAKDLIVINFTQDTFDSNDEVIQVNRSLKILVLRNETGELTGEIKILD